VIVSSRTTIAVGQGEAVTEVVVGIATIGETEVEEVTQTASGWIDRTDRIARGMGIGRIVLSVLIDLIVPITPAAGGTDGFCRSSIPDT
jgi:hypothetical protein